MTVDMLSVGMGGWFVAISTPDISGISPDLLELLNETCTIQEKTGVTFDDFNQPINDGWTDESTLVLCRFETVTGIEVIDNKKAVVETVNLMVPTGTTITEDRRVIRDDTGEVYSILLVNHGDAEEEEHHIEATLDHVKDD